MASLFMGGRQEKGSMVLEEEEEEEEEQEEEGGEGEGRQPFVPSRQNAAPRDDERDGEDEAAESEKTI